MKKARFTETQIVGVLKEYENGRAVLDLCREYGISKATFFNWKSKYGGMEVPELKRLKELELENVRLKKMYADLSLDYQIVKEVLSKKALSSGNRRS
jgi:putative transposase